MTFQIVMLIVFVCVCLLYAEVNVDELLLHTLFSTQFLIIDLTNGTNNSNTTMNLSFKCTIPPWPVDFSVQKQTMMIVEAFSQMLDT